MSAETTALAPLVGPAAWREAAIVEATREGGRWKTLEKNRASWDGRGADVLRQGDIMDRV